MGYLLSINTSHVDKLPKDTSPARWAGYNDAFRNVELTPGELAGIIRGGYAIAPQMNGRRKRENFRLAQHIGVDLDDGTYTWDALISMELVAMCAAIIHTTASHTDEHPRYRVVFLLEEPITDPDDYTQAVGAFMRAFGAAADPACKDPARLFFGAEDCSLLHMPDNVVTADDLAAILEAYPPDLQVDPQKEKIPQNTARPATVATPTDSAIVPPSEPSAARRDAHLDALLDNVRTAPDGSKWFILKETAYTLGGYGGAGYFTFKELQKALEDAIDTRRATVANMPAAYATIEQGLLAGWSAPLYYKVKDGANGRQHADALPTDARGRLRWILERRRAELEQAIAAADLETCPDFGAMTHEYTLVMERLEATA